VPNRIVRMKQVLREASRAADGSMGVGLAASRPADQAPLKPNGVPNVGEPRDGRMTFREQDDPHA
jgi:hypothetical protein